MVAAAIIGTALGGSVPGPAYGLFVAGLDVRLKAGTSSNRYGVPLDTITVTENGPGGVSSLAFRIEDPLSEITVNNGDPVLYMDLSDSIPEFNGWVQHFTTTVFGLGRAYDVEAIGVEAVLDWITVPTMTFAAGTLVPVAVQMALAAGITPGGFALDTAWDPTSTNGSLTFPMGDLSSTLIGTRSAFLDNALTIDAGTFREAIRQITAAASRTNASSGATEPLDLPVNVTVDYWFGLRMWLSQGSARPSDYSLLAINDVPAGPILAADLQHEIDGSGVVRGVYVIGGNAAGTGVIIGGSGLPGPIATLEDSTILTSTARDLAGAAYLRDKAQAVRGSFRRETFNDTSTVSDHLQAGSVVNIIDAQIGLSDTQLYYMIGSITKTYHGNSLETWQITYGGLPPSLPRALRRLTRAVRN